MSHKIEVLLAPSTEQGRGHAGQDALALEQHVRNGVPSDVHVRVVVHDPEVLRGLAHGEETAAAPAYVALLDLAVPDARSLAGTLDAVRAALATSGFDRQRSAVVVGTEHVVVPGDEPLMLAMTVNRRADITPEEFTSHWSTTHAELGRQVPGSEGYRQVHADPGLSQSAAVTIGVGGPQYDGVALAYYSTDDAFTAIMANTEVVQVLIEDERRFIDHTTAAMVVGRAAR